MFGEFLTSRDSFLKVYFYAAEGREILQITTLLDRTADTVLATASHRDTLGHFVGFGQRTDPYSQVYSCKVASL